MVLVKLVSIWLLFSGTHSMVVTEHGLCKDPSCMFLKRRFNVTCSYKFIDSPNELLHKAFIHTVITKSTQAKANAIAISKISNATLRIATKYL